MSVVSIEGEFIDVGVSDEIIDNVLIGVSVVSIEGEFIDVGESDAIIDNVLIGVYVLIGVLDSIIEYVPSLLIVIVTEDDTDGLFEILAKLVPVEDILGDLDIDGDPEVLFDIILVFVPIGDKVGVLELVVLPELHADNVGVFDSVLLEDDDLDTILVLLFVGVGDIDILESIEYVDDSLTELDTENDCSNDNVIAGDDDTLGDTLDEDDSDIEDVSEYENVFFPVDVVLTELLDL